MDGISRRQAVTLSAAGGVALIATLGRAEASDGEDVIFANEKTVLFKVKDVTLDGIDEANRKIAASFGQADAPIKLTGLPLAENVAIRVSLVFPGSVNNLPFNWGRLKELI